MSARRKTEFHARVLAWASKLGVKPRAVYVRPMRRKWASCSTAGTVTFNYDLTSLADNLGDYVIVHELLHLAVPNHGKLWRSLMRVHLGDYEILDAQLRQLATAKAQPVTASSRSSPPRPSRRRGRFRAGRS